MYKLEVKHSFYKKFKKLDVFIQEKIKFLLKDLKYCENLLDFPGLKKLVGYKGFYRIRVGMLRLGFYKNGNTLIFYYIGNRGDFYKKFSKNFLNNFNF